MASSGKRSVESLVAEVVAEQDAEAVASPALEALKESIVAELPPEPVRPTPPPAAKAEGADDEETLGTIESTLTELASDPGKASEFTEEEWADAWGLLFGFVADERGSHWELQRKRGLRLGAYTRKVVERYGGIPESWVKHIPLVMLALLLAATVFRAWKEDQRVHARPIFRIEPKENEAGEGEGAP